MVKGLLLAMSNKNDQVFQNELVIRRLRSGIQNLKYDRDLISQELKTFRGMLNRQSLNKDIQTIDNKIKQLQVKLSEIEHNQQQSLIELPMNSETQDQESNLPQFHIQNAEVVVDSVKNLHTEKITMTKIDVKLGDNATIHGDFIVANSIKDSFNQADSASISTNLKSVLKDLVIAVGKMSENLPDESAKQVARDLETLTSEATSSSPRQQWWELSVEGLKTAAKNVGEIGKPVLGLIRQIVPILLAASV